MTRPSLNRHRQIPGGDRRVTLANIGAACHFGKCRRTLPLERARGALGWQGMAAWVLVVVVTLRFAFPCDSQHRRRPPPSQWDFLVIMPTGWLAGWAERSCREKESALDLLSNAVVYLPPSFFSCAYRLIAKNGLPALVLTRRISVHNCRNLVPSPSGSLGGHCDVYPQLFFPGMMRRPCQAARQGFVSKYHDNAKVWAGREGERGGGGGVVAGKASGVVSSLSFQIPGF